MNIISIPILINSNQKGFSTSSRYFLLVLISFICTKCNQTELIPPAGIELDIKSDSIVFAVIGDYGFAGKDEEEVAYLVNGWEPEFIITTGDNNYPTGELTTLKQNISQYYEDYIYNFDAPAEFQCKGKAFQDKENRFFPSPGNHDVNPDNDIINYLNFFTLPGKESYYKFRWGSVNFFSLNSLPANMDAQKAWLTNELANAIDGFNIVYFHHSPYGIGKHSASEKMQWDFESLGADLVITGHDHIYGRIKKTGDTRVHYIVNGVGGKSLYDCNESNLPANSFSVICYDADFGAIRGSASDQKLVLEFYAVSSPDIAIDRLELLR
jgi:hypothetical protein